MDLVGPLALERQKKARISLDAAALIRVELGDPASDPFRIELGIPGLVERVADEHALAIAADLEHLRSAVERPAGSRMARVGYDSPEAHLADQLGRERVGHVVLLQIAGSPAG